MLAADEHVKTLGPELDRAHRQALDLLARAPAAPPTGPGGDTPGETAPPTSPEPTEEPAAEVLAGGAETGIDAAAGLRLLEDIARRLREEPAARLTVHWQVVKPR